MTRNFFITIALFLAILSPANAQNTKTITLKDGSQIQGRVIGMDDGKYVIETTALGQVTIGDDEVVSISAPGQVAPAPSSVNPAAVPPAQTFSKAQMDSVQSQIAANPQMMQEISALASDPEIMAIISDPAFMQVVQSRDPAAIQANPRTQALMENPKIKALVEKLQSLQQN